MNTQLPRVEIHWQDIVSDSSWVESEKVANATPVDVVSVGYIVKETDEHIVIAHSMIEKADQKSSDYTVIPWGCVRKMWNMKRNGIYAE